mgnify:CR=1 FL=1
MEFNQAVVHKMNPSRRRKIPQGGGAAAMRTFGILVRNLMYSNRVKIFGNLKPFYLLYSVSVFMCSKVVFGRLHQYPRKNPGSDTLDFKEAEIN